MENKNVTKYPIKEITIFKVDNFLNNDLYQKIKKNFNNYLADPFQVKNFLDKKNLKYCFNSRMEIYDSIKSNFSEVKELDEIIKSKEFYTFFFKKFFFNLLNSKKKNFAQLIRLFKIPKDMSLNSNKIKDFKTYFDSHGHEKIQKINIEKSKLLDIFINKIEITAEYSYILNNGKIVPHTDDIDKIFSLMLYFPKYEEKENSDLKNKEEKIGTVFWNSKKKNFDNIHQEGELELEFEKKNKEIMQLPFVGNKLYGFIKNDLSWHSVKKINLGEDYVRNSININFRFINN